MRGEKGKGKDIIYEGKGISEEKKKDLETRENEKR
jgi:hypothetical protein